jgi:hypothetical protein
MRASPRLPYDTALYVTSPLFQMIPLSEKLLADAGDEADEGSAATG